MSDEILTLESPDSFSVGAYTESDKALCGKSLATTDYPMDVVMVAFVQGYVTKVS